MQLPEPLERLIGELSRLPGVGPKTAQRLAFHFLRADRERAERLSEALLDLKARIDETLICVVEAPLDVLAIERTAEYRGLFHVLHGVLSPIDNVGAEEIHIPELLDRLAGGEVREVIVATNPDIEGEATAAYLQRVISPLGVQVTRPAHGLPFGGDLEYADELTLARAMSRRQVL
ncbi:MAG: recombination protein RecR [Chloroflexi bacterium]|nr:MAG: recombination protein RecR [Chloroflexota bacterium]